MRELSEHKVNDVNEQLKLTAIDEPNANDANAKYLVEFPDGKQTVIDFQSGPIKEAGVNGLTNELLLSIVVDRVRTFQKGPFACRENAIALTKIEEALLWLHSRTRGRVARGVEGTNKT